MSAHLFTALLDLGREEHALVTDGRWDDLAELNARREALMAVLPAAAPADALPTLREAARLQALSETALRENLIATGADLRRLRTGRTAAAGYAAGTGIAAPLPAFNQAG